VGSQADLQRLANEIRRIYRQDPSGAAARIEALLKARLGGMPGPTRSAALAALAGMFETAPEGAGAGGPDTASLRRVVGLLLGREPPEDVPAEELLERLGEALNTVFDMLNQVVHSIDLNLAGGGGEETIRHVFGSGLAGAAGPRSLESYLGQIKRAFLIAQESFKRTASEQLGGILQELDPEVLSKEAGGGLKFGPLRKAELFGLYEEKYRRCRQWFDTGRFMEDLLRGFEKNCQRIAEQRQGGSS